MTKPALVLTERRTKVLKRRAVVARLVADRDENLLAISGLGNPSWDLMAAGDHPLNFYDLGAMGSASALGLGLALAQPERRVLVITGDGELLMGLGTLATIMGPKPKNLAIAVLDNEAYGETGLQPTHTALGVDLAAVAKTIGFPHADVVWDGSELESAARRLRSEDGPLLAVFKILPEKLPIVSPPRDGSYVKGRFREKLLGKP